MSDMQAKADALGEAIGSTTSYADAVNYLRDNEWELVDVREVRKRVQPFLGPAARDDQGLTDYLLTGKQVHK